MISSCSFSFLLLSGLLIYPSCTIPPVTTMSFWLQGQNPNQACHACGSMVHTTIECPEQKCSYCKKIGHHKSKCPKAPPCGICHQKGHKTESCRSKRKSCSRCGGSADHEVQRCYNIPSIHGFITPNPHRGKSSSTPQGQHVPKMGLMNRITSMGGNVESPPSDMVRWLI